MKRTSFLLANKIDGLNERELSRRIFSLIDIYGLTGLLEQQTSSEILSDGS